MRTIKQFFLTIALAIVGCHIVFANSESTDLAIDMSTSYGTLNPGESPAFTITVRNKSSYNIASNGIVTVSLPEGTTDFVSDGCTETAPLTATCLLAELTPQTSVDITFSTTIHVAGHNLFSATVTADQFDSIDKNNNVTELVTVMAYDLPAIDLNIDLSAVSGTNKALNSYAYFDVKIKNLHPTNTAIAPLIVVSIPESYKLNPNNICTVSGQKLFCEMNSLTPGAESDIKVSTITRSIDIDATLQATVSSTQNDDEYTNNETQLVTTIYLEEVLCGASNPMCAGGYDPGADSTTGGDSDASTNTGTNIDEDADSTNFDSNATAAATSGNSGGGSIAHNLIWFLLMLVVCRRYTSIISKSLQRWRDI